MRHHRIGTVITIGAEIQQGLAATAKAGINRAIGIEPHHTVVKGITRATRWLGSGVAGDQDLAVALRHHRLGTVNGVAAEIQQGLAAGAKAGVNCAVGIEPHHAVVIGIARATRWLGSGVAGDQNLAVALRHHRIGKITGIAAQIQQGLAATAKAGIYRAVGIEPHHAVVIGIARATSWLGTGVAGEQDLAVALRHHRIGKIKSIAAQIQQRLVATAQPLAIDAAGAVHTHHTEAVDGAVLA